MNETFVNCGSLRPPGPVGRLTRVFFGAACLSLVVALWQEGPSRFIHRFPNIPDVWPWLFAALYLLSYVVNIGFGTSWKHRPQIVALVLLMGAAGLDLMRGYGLNGMVLPASIWLLLMYVYVHLGVSFVLSAVLATPGCEMRAIPHAAAKIFRREAREHHCPVGPLGCIDAWEARRSARSDDNRPGPSEP